jgi:protein-S-isoprenylcysteine O-methyltransferase Ste14
MMKLQKIPFTLWVRAIVYMVVVGGGWLIVLPLLIWRLEYGSFFVLVRSTFSMLLGSALFVTGFLLALVAGYQLIVTGYGTPLPLDPPQKLVTTGPYRYVRNPQAIAMVLMVVGEILIFRSRFLWTLLPLTLLYLEGFVARWEERQLLQQHGQEYIEYKSKVRKWIPIFVYKGGI